jgi:hypothetical protein
MKENRSARKRPIIEKVSGIKDLATGKWNYEFGFPQADGTRGRVIVPGANANSVSKLTDCLNGNGAVWESSSKRKTLVQEAIDSKPDKIIHQLAGAGWQTPKSKPIFFCYGTNMVGAPKGAVEYAPPQLINRSRARFFVERGTLAEWQTRVAAKATLSTSLTVCISAAFAAPLMRASKLQNFALHVFGKTRAGKTTLLLSAMSVYGMGQERALKNWNSSGSVELLEAAAGFNDCILPLNEVGSRKGKRALTYEVLRDVYAQYSEGGDRDRHSSWEAAHGGGSKPFYGICIVTAEHSVAGYAEKAGEARDGGEFFRAIDVVAARDGEMTIFDLASETADQRQFLQSLHDDLEFLHGTAAAPYIKSLLKTGPSKINARVKALITEFVGHMPSAPHDGVAGQLAKHFGLLYAGGVLGIEFGILPWSKTHLQGALKRAFEDALEYCKVVDPLVIGLKILEAQLRENIFERKLGSKFGSNAHAGYWTIIGGRKSIVVHARQFGAWFSSNAQRDLVLHWLARNRLLTRAAESNGGLLSPAELTGVLRRWPDKKLVRSFEFTNPFSSANTTEELPKSPVKFVEPTKASDYVADEDGWPIGTYQLVNGRRVSILYEDEVRYKDGTL